MGCTSSRSVLLFEDADQGEWTHQGGVVALTVSAVHGVAIPGCHDGVIENRVRSRSRLVDSQLSL